MNIHELCCVGHITKDKIVTPKKTVFMPGGTSFYFSHAIKNFDDIDYALVTALLRVWQDSVTATHHFLTQADIAALVPYVDEALRGIATLVAVHDGGQAVGLMGVQDGKIEMLFVAPSHIGHGLGGRLVRLAIGQLGATLVDVNEQNESAAAFYRHMGFKVIRRNETDGQGNPFPILEMSL